MYMCAYFRVRMFVCASVHEFVRLVEVPCLCVSTRLSLTLLFALLAADGGWAAVKQLQSHAVDLVLLDVFMPEVDGIQLLRLIKQAGGNETLIISEDVPRSCCLCCRQMTVCQRNGIPPDVSPHSDDNKRGPHHTQSVL